jgi:hypothetical protein
MNEQELQIRLAWARARTRVYIQSRTAVALYDLFLTSQKAWEAEVERVYAARLQEVGIEEHLRAGREHLFNLDSIESVRDTAAGAFFVNANDICQSLAKGVNLKPGYTLKAGDSLRHGVTFTELAHAAAANFRHYTGWPSPEGKNEIGILKTFGVPPDMVGQNVCGLVVQLLKPLNADSLDLMLHKAVNEIGETGITSLGAIP